MGLFSSLFFGIMNQSNDYKHQGYNRREPIADDYIHSGEIERDNYDDGKRNIIDEKGELSDYSKQKGK